MTPTVSIIIPTFNRAATIERAVGSVLAQTGVIFELIVVDDGSTDGTLELLKPLAEANDFAVVKQAHQGVSAARNNGIKKSCGQFVAFLDSDDEWLPGKLAAQLDYFKHNQAMALVQTQEIWVRNGRRVNPGRRHSKQGGDIFLPSVELCLISPSAVMLRRSLLDEVGLFDEQLPAAEDYDLWLRVTARYPAGLIDRDFVIRYGGHPDQLSAGHSLDKYRVMALEKILKHDLNAEQRRKVKVELEKRKHIYLNGLAKRMIGVDKLG